ncbi:MAG: polysaccharide deacetylase family protein [Emcibacter sp.]|nr:polysaccharide deacetylase family protein [Emcibacter sp.]
MRKVNHRFLFSLLLSAQILICLSFTAAKAQAVKPEDSAIILMYHRFGEGRYPSTNITLEQFDAQLAELKKEKYNIVALDVIVEALRNKVKLPPRTIAITIDDAYFSILENAWPRLKQANLPFTLFISTEPINREITGYMTWQQIRDLAKDPLVSIGHHAHTHDHLIHMSREKATKDINAASEIYQKELGAIPDIFAYPFGEFSPMLIKILKDKKIKAAFGQFSSAASSSRNLFGLPRFSFNEKYADMERFRLIVNARALPAYDILPIGAVIKRNPPQIGFTVDKKVRGLSAMSCYPSHLGKAADITRIGGNRIEIRFDKPLPQGRSRLNCTLPGPDRRWYWFGLPFFVM